MVPSKNREKEGSGGGHHWLQEKKGGGDFLSLLKILFVAYPEEEREKLIAII